MLWNLAFSQIGTAACDCEMLHVNLTCLRLKVVTPGQVRTPNRRPALHRPEALKAKAV